MASAISTFLQHDGSIAKQCEIKLDNIEKAWSAPRTLPAALVCAHDALAGVRRRQNREKVELKMINFGFSYMIPEGARSESQRGVVGSSDDHEDGYPIEYGI